MMPTRSLLSGSVGLGLLLLVVLLLVAAASAISTTNDAREVFRLSLTDVPSTWQEEQEEEAQARPAFAAASASTGRSSMTFTLYLRQRNLAWLERRFYEVSDPENSREYARHLTHRELREMLAPSDDDFSRILEWISTSVASSAGESTAAPPVRVIDHDDDVAGGGVVRGVRGRHHLPAAAAADDDDDAVVLVRRHAHGDAVTLTAPTRVVEQLFGGGGGGGGGSEPFRVGRFRHAASGRTAAVGVGSGVVPGSVSDLVDVVTGLGFFPPVATLTATPADGNDGGSGISSIGGRRAKATSRHQRRHHRPATTSMQFASSPSSAGGVTQKICKSKDCRGGGGGDCKTNHLPTGKCIPAQDGKHSALLTCHSRGVSGTDIVQLVFLNSTDCTGPNQPVTLSTNTCTQDTDGSYVEFSCDGGGGNITPWATDDGAVGPNTLYTLYGVDAASTFPLSSSSSSSSSSGPSVGVVEFLASGAYEDEDLFGSKTFGAGFFARAALSPIPKNDSIVKVGTFKPDSGEMEATLDIEYLMAMSRGLRTFYWTEDRWMLDFVTSFQDRAAKKEAVPDIVSISFAWSEQNSCTQPTGKPNPTCTELGIDVATYIARTNTEFMKMGAAGHTLVVSSGDDGAPGNKGLAASCEIKTLDPLFPAASPYVTTVGGTMLMRKVVGGSHDNDGDDGGGGDYGAARSSSSKMAACPPVPMPQCGDYCEDDVMCGKGYPGACGGCVTDTNSCGVGCGGACEQDSDCAALKCPICGTTTHSSNNTENASGKKQKQCTGGLGSSSQQQQHQVRVLRRRQEILAAQTARKAEQARRRLERFFSPHGPLDDDGGGGGGGGGGRSLSLTSSPGGGLPPGCPDPLCIENDGCATSTLQAAASIPGAGITTGGGFSNFAPRPRYQNAAVDGYLSAHANLLPPASAFNASGRAFPDVSAVANNYAVWMGTWLSVDGTSAATPVFAGLLAVLADQVASSSSSFSGRLGFANPMLYKAAATKPAAFTDITRGNNKCTSKCCATIGYTATAGWDPVTGLGTPNMKELIAYLADKVA